MSDPGRRDIGRLVALLRLAHVGLAAVCVVAIVLVSGAQGEWLVGLGIGVYVVSLAFSLVLLALRNQPALLPRQRAVPDVEAARLRRLLVTVAILGLALLVGCGIVAGAAQAAALVALTVISAALWAYEVALFWQGP